MRNLVNYYSHGEFYEGIITHYSDYCIKHMDLETCKKFYNKITKENVDDVVCPYGYLCKKCGERIYNGLISRESSNMTKLKPKLDKKALIYTDSELFNLINNDEELLFESSANTLKDDCLNDFLHDVNKSNVFIADNLNMISQDRLDKKDKNRLLSSIQLTDFFKKRVELYRYVSNPTLIQTGKLREREAFKLFDIYRKIFEEFGKSQNKRVKLRNLDLLTGNDTTASTKFNANDSITVLPFLLIDNAMKYSKDNTNIDVKIYSENGYARKIIISNYPSYVITEDVNLFFQRGFRSLNNTSKSSGSGLGLSIVKQICDYNNINIELHLTSDENGAQIFEVNLAIEGVE